MKFENEFQVEAPVDEVFKALLDLERIAPAMPGAQVTDTVSDDAYKVAIKVKLGPMTMNYKGDVVIAEKDPAAHRATMHVKAREARGQGNATADVTMSLDEQEGGTHATIAAEVQLAGKAAAMGRGLIEDVSGKLVDQFANNLEEMLSANGGAEAAPPPRQEASEPEGIDALGIASSMATDRLRDPKVLGAVIGILLLVVYLLGRRG
jgi:carbon monoxide dehydrogenase subunit G